VLTRKLLWHLSCTKFVISVGLVDDKICRSTADVQLVGYISDSNPSVLLKQRMNSFNIVRRSTIGRTAREVINDACSATMKPFLCVLEFSPYCGNIPGNLGRFYSSDHKNRMTARCSIMVQLERGVNCLHYDCTSFTERLSHNMPRRSSAHSTRHARIRAV